MELNKGLPEKESVCRNCKYFARRQISDYRGGWGDCVGKRDTDDAKGKADVFVWADDACDRFEPKTGVAADVNS